MLTNEQGAPVDLDESLEDLYENAPCGYLTTRWDGTIVKISAAMITGRSALCHACGLASIRFMSALLRACVDRTTTR